MWVWALIQTGLLILIVRKINRFFNKQEERQNYCKESKFLQQFKLSKELILEKFINFDKIHIKNRKVKESVSIIGGNIEKTLITQGYIQQVCYTNSDDSSNTLLDCEIVFTYIEGAHIDQDICGIATKSKVFGTDREFVEVFIDLSKEAYEEISRLLSSNSLTASLETKYDLLNKRTKDDKAAPTAFRVMSIGGLTPEVTETFLGDDFSDDLKDIHL